MHHVPGVYGPLCSCANIRLRHSSIVIKDSRPKATKTTTTVCVMLIRTPETFHCLQDVSELRGSVRMIGSQMTAAGHQRHRECPAEVAHRSEVPSHGLHGADGKALHGTCMAHLDLKPEAGPAETLKRPMVQQL